MFQILFLLSYSSNDTFSNSECFFANVTISGLVSDAAFLHIAPNRQQHFEYESVTFHCEGFNDSTQLRGIRNAKEFNPLCDIKGTSAGSFCTFDQIYAADSGEYWCETEGQRSNSVNITVTGRFVVFVVKLGKEHVKC